MTPKIFRGIGNGDQKEKNEGQLFDVMLEFFFFLCTVGLLVFEKGQGRKQN